MQFKLSTIVGLLAIASPVLASDAAIGQIDKFAALAKDVQTTANSIEATNALEKSTVGSPTHTSQWLTSYTNHELKDTIDRFYLLNNAERSASKRFSEEGQAVAADKQQAACNSFTNVRYSVL